MAEPCIQPFGEGQLDAIVALSLRAWAPVFAGMEREMPRHVFDAFYPDGWQVRQRADVTAVCGDRGNEIWVATIDETVAGFVALRMHHEDRMGEVYMIAVDPDHQHHGIGAELIAFSLDRMRAAGLAIAMVDTGPDEGHAPARRAYERAGFALWPAMRYFREL